MFTAIGKRYYYEKLDDYHKGRLVRWLAESGDIICNTTIERTTILRIGFAVDYEPDIDSFLSECFGRFYKYVSDLSEKEGFSLDFLEKKFRDFEPAIEPSEGMFEFLQVLQHQGVITDVEEVAEELVKRAVGITSRAMLCSAERLIISQHGSLQQLYSESFLRSLTKETLVARADYYMKGNNLPVDSEEWHNKKIVLEESIEAKLGMGEAAIYIGRIFDLEKGEAKFNVGQKKLYTESFKIMALYILACGRNVEGTFLEVIDALYKEEVDHGHTSKEMDQYWWKVRENKANCDVNFTKFRQGVENVFFASPEVIGNRKRIIKADMERLCKKISEIRQQPIPECLSHNTASQKR